jgi:hypothetical protein
MGLQVLQYGLAALICPSTVCYVAEVQVDTAKLIP